MYSRTIRNQDAEKFMDLMSRVEAESLYMLYGAGERELNLAKQKEMIASMLKAGNSTILVAEENGQLIGYAIAIGGSSPRNQHSAHLVIGIRSDHQGKGLGTYLLEELEKWAVDHGLHRLELTVVNKNTSAIALYEKMGFKKEGTKIDSLQINREFVDEFYMAKILS
ncbi:Protein N-acetyltransferase, RimJ/RimL family [Salinibacillus kushneri]|uniref:Protein N-acetyltransferase, RimJ/RimL family n=1 Tax=Salinibacillus kushneri TaxID=237682 RepID=A0A1I0DVE1_9BACI|nr:GNAT family N-acetyltransferase [Salinibacillus kushneri]SET36309.1 Protein N-acetyltransferase, RimJ/RimL family [Salinibacillus kushneri]